MFLQVACASIVAFLLGVTLTFAGYRFFLRLLPFWGFFSGFALGAGIVANFIEGDFLATGAGWIVGVLVGVLFATFSYLFYIVGIAIFAGSVGYSIGAGLMYFIFNDPTILAFIIGMVGAIIVAGLTLLLNLQKYVIILITAWGGATVLLLSVLLALGRIQLTDLGLNPVQTVLSDSFIWTIVALGLFGLGAFVQFVSTNQYVMPRSGRRAW